MGKKRVVKKGSDYTTGGAKTRSTSRAPKKKVDRGILHISATYNNTKVSLTDPMGEVLCWTSSGALSFSGAKKGTPFAAAKAGELIGEKATAMGVQEVSVVVKGVGVGRESAIRGFISRGITITRIRDATPVPHNGPRPPKPRRV